MRDIILDTCIAAIPKKVLTFNSVDASILITQRR